MPNRMTNMLLDHHLAACTLGIHAQRTRTATNTTVSCTRHITASLVKLGAVDGCAAETLAGVLGSGDGPTILVAEGHAGVIGHCGTVEVGPLR